MNKTIIILFLLITSLLYSSDNMINLLDGVWFERVVYGDIIVKHSWGISRSVANASVEFDLKKTFFNTSLGGWSISNVRSHGDLIYILFKFNDGHEYEIAIKIIDKNTIVFEKMSWFDSIGIIDFYGYEHPYYRIGGPNTPIIKMVSVDNLRLRETPDVSSKVILLMKKNTKIEIIDLGKMTFVNKVSGTWIKVRTELGEEGWCFDAYLEELK
ncbi:MAG: hypothetical protein A2015_09080 [Spirochaetes bacterium GWF1_31_7]|nr:MAG: hypothetical protein A2Y30_09140 [Spirochaetes bacterium GWE1_32_154]OHD46627.1 MAG: hypothetical protein A2Y29_07715 [Spirochaetes bacterium GWE2_31_10]OHD47641.1 MAG: hypothetical protein A2015_09080 [Spirochaetes bacterium GWF1_31_7]HBD94418.1 hypothetical protein [Spirochaetia bacterium]HBI37663.1 hypothetical protein [Spirochaetia bacterium]